VEAQFGSIPGVIKTRVGYTGGSTKNPTYHNLGDHTETVEIEYDPSRVSYRELLTIFWESHEPLTRSWSRQYMSAVFYHTGEEKRIAYEEKAQRERTLRSQLFTEILPAGTFYPAEGYHQKYYVRSIPALMKEIQALFPSDEEFVASPLVMRMNSYLGGYATFAQLEHEIDRYKLSQDIREKVIKIVRSRMR